MAIANIILAQVTFSQVIWWIVVGLIAGALAGLVMRGAGYGIVGDIIIGIIGAIIGGWIFSQFGVGTGGLIGSIIVAFIGACILIAILRLIAGATRGRAP